MMMGLYWLSPPGGSGTAKALLGHNESQLHNHGAVAIKTLSFLCAMDQGRHQKSDFYQFKYVAAGYKYLSCPLNAIKSYYV